MINLRNPTMTSLMSRRKLSEETGTCLPSLAKNHSISNPKPCLKRRSSVPIKDGEMHSHLGSCDSFEDMDSNFSYDDSSSSLSSRKSVCFADSIGEDLCHIKTFKKELFELQSDYFHEENWTARMWRWQIAPFEDDLEDSVEDWYIQDDVLEVIDEIDIEDGDDLIGMEDELIRAMSPFQIESVKTSSTSSKSSVVAPTFLCPKDLPEFKLNLKKWGVSLESVEVQDKSITGSIRIDPTVVPSHECEVSVQFSFNNWSKIQRIQATPSLDRQDRFHFEISTAQMECGDDLELIVMCDFQDTESAAMMSLKDDNLGLRYRLICKNTPKFAPGKSLW